MAKVNRVAQQPYGLNGSSSHFGQFGSRAAGAPLPTKDPAVIQALTAFTQNGWLDAINLGNKAPFLEDMNGLFYLIFYQLQSLFQDGVSVWDPGTTYYVGSMVRKDGTFELYGSLTNSNLNNALPNQTDNGFWHFLNPPTTQPGIVSDFAGPSAPFGYLLCDGSQYPQNTYPALYAAIGSTWNTFNGIAGPALGNFRVPDLRSLTTIGAGQGTGFSNRTLATLIGEEAHTLVQGEIPNYGLPSTWPQDVGLTFGSRYGIFSLNAVNQIQGSTGYLAPSQINSGGGGGAHNNMQPSAVINKVIKY